MKAKLLLCVLCAVVFVLSGCNHLCIKLVTDSETLEITKDDVQSARAMSNEQKQLYISILFTEEGRKKILQMTERNKGKDVSMYFGKKPIWKDVYLPEPIDSPDIQITMPDEETMKEVIDCYNKAQMPK